MKRNPQHRQADLFDSETRALQTLASRQEELVDLLSRLLWQVVSAQVVAGKGDEDEQDRA